jgi:hypothetical protein
MCCFRMSGTNAKKIESKKGNRTTMKLVQVNQKAGFWRTYTHLAIRARRHATGPIVDIHSAVRIDRLSGTWAYASKSDMPF